MTLLIFIGLMSAILCAWAWSAFKNSPSREEDLAKDFIALIQQQATQRRHSNWSPAVSKRRRREAKKMRDQNYVDWQKMRLQCQLHGLDFDKFATHAKKIAVKYGVKLN